MSKYTMSNYDPFTFTVAGFFSLDQSEPLRLQCSRPAAELKSAWVHADVLGLPKDLKRNMLERELNTCHFCGFHSKKYQEVVVRYGKEWLPDNIKAACIFCAQCLILDRVIERRSGVMVSLPEIPQHELNYILKIIYVARISQGLMANKARELLDMLMSRRKRANQTFSDDPADLVEKMDLCRTEGQRSRLYKSIKELRLLPLDRRIIRESDLEFNQFPQILAYWRSKDGPFGGRTPPKWQTNGFDTYLNLLSSRAKQSQPTQSRAKQSAGPK